MTSQGHCLDRDVVRRRRSIDCSPRHQRVDCCDGTKGWETATAHDRQRPNGVVSKDEFLHFMGRVFDRIDADKDGTLEPKEQQQTAIPRVVRRNCVHRACPECTGGQ
jgi:hypothetical protein